MSILLKVTTIFCTIVSQAVNNKSCTSSQITSSSIYNLVFQQQNRYKFWGWGEVFYHTKKTPSQVKKIVESNGYELQDPLSTLVFSRKNHEHRALDNIFDNYNNPRHFELRYSHYGLSTNFVIHAQSPAWQNYNSNTDWYWKQNWIYKYGQLLSAFPGVKNIYLCCSAALENSHKGSDIDLMIMVKKNWVWITKPYFAILSKVIKYYDLNFGLVIFYLLTNQVTKLEALKYNNIIDKVKIDFGLVFENECQLEKYYKNKERNLFVWSALKLENSFDKETIPLPYSATHSKVKEFETNLGLSIQTKKQISYLAFIFLKILFYLTLILIAPIGILNYWYEQKHKENYNKLVLWNIYSQYNIVY